MTRRQENIEATLKNLAAIQAFKKSDAYDLLIGPLQKEIDGLKHAYGMKAKEAERFDGLYEGLTFVTSLLAKYEQDGQFAKEQLEQIERKKLIDQIEIDSTSL